VPDGLELGYFAPYHKYVSGKTLWSTVKDLTRRMFYFRNGDGVIRVVRLNKLNFNVGAKHAPIPIQDAKPYVMDVTNYV